MFDYLASIFSEFSDPTQRIYIGYLALSLAIAFLWLLLVKRVALADAVTKVFDSNAFFSRSAIADYKIFVLNRIFFLFVSPLLLTQTVIGVSLYLLLYDTGWFIEGGYTDAPPWLVVALFSATTFVFDDFTKYLTHRFMHRWPILWALHKVHHSAETMTPITVHRVHPLEGVVYILRNAVAQGVVLSVFAFLFGESVDLMTILGVNILVFLFHVTGSNLRHSHIEIKYWRWLEFLLISPAQHQLHHSIARQHHDKNFGSVFAFWDWAFGSLHLSVEDNEELTFGLDTDEMSPSRVLDIYLRPLKDIAQLVSRKGKKTKS